MVYDQELLRFDAKEAFMTSCLFTENEFMETLQKIRQAALGGETHLITEDKLSRRTWRLLEQRGYYVNNYSSGDVITGNFIQWLV